jgi:peptidyl-prolyl cis-trans isomerase SurA
MLTLRLRNIFFILIFVFGFCQVRAEMVDGIAAVVNEDIITFTDVRTILRSTEETLRKVYPPGDPQLVEKIMEARKQTLEQLIDRRLIIQEFKSRGGKIPESFIEEVIRNEIDEKFGRDRSVFIKTLEALGRNLENYKDQKREEVIVNEMRRREIIDEIIISPYKIEKYYNEHPEGFKEGDKVKLRMIYIKKGDTNEETEGARSLIQEILVKLTTGSDFSSLASVYSEGPEKKQGGELGFIGKETLREELCDAAFKLNAGQYSRPIETKDGFYLLQVQEKKAANMRSLDESRDLIEKLLVQGEREKLYKHWIQALKRKAYIRTY